MPPKPNKKKTGVAAKIKKLFIDEPTPLEIEEQQKKLIAENREGAMEAVNILKAINFSLSPMDPEVMEKGKFEKIRNEVVKNLSMAAPITTFDTAKMDATICWCAKAFQEAVESGMEHTANWASKALLNGVVQQRVNIPNTELDHAEELKELRENYLGKFVTMVKFSKELDYRLNELAQKLSFYGEEILRFEKEQEELAAERETAEGKMAMELLEESQYNPSAMNEAGQELALKASRIRNLGISLDNRDAQLTQLINQITDIDLLITQRESNMNKARMDFQNKPRIIDRTLTAQLNEMYLNIEKEAAAVQQEATELTDLLQKSNSRMRMIMNNPDRGVANKQAIDFMKRREKQQRMIEERAAAAAQKIEAEKQEIAAATNQHRAMVTN